MRISGLMYLLEQLHCALGLLLALDRFSFFSLAMLRGATDLLLTAHRLWYCRKFREEFVP